MPRDVSLPLTPQGSMSHPPPPRGILRNKHDLTPVRDQELDRKIVIDNTRLNAQLGKDPSALTECTAKTGDKAANLKWDEINLYKTEQEKCATMRIDEPKTPYDGGFDPTGEYYRDDDDDNEECEIPLLDLGQGQFDTKQEPAGGLHGGKIEATKELEQKEEEEDAKPIPQLAEERHKSFEEMRKEHYHLKGVSLKQPIPDEYLSDD